MPTNQALSAPMLGLGTIKLADTSQASATLASLLLAAGVSAATLESVRHIEIQCITGPIYYENDGSEADANCFQLPTGAIREIRNCGQMIKEQLTIYAAGAYGSTTSPRLARGHMPEWMNASGLRVATTGQR